MTLNSPHAHAGLEQAIAAVGTRSKLAALLGISPQAVAQWRAVPVARCLAVERITGVSRYELRPDIYGAPPECVMTGATVRRVA